MSIRKLLMVAFLAMALVPAVAGAQQAMPASQSQQAVAVTSQQIEDDTPQDAFVPFIGFNAAGGLADAVSNLGDGAAKPKTYGASILFWGPGLLAGELDLGYSPNFFENAEYQGGRLVAVGATSNLMTLTLNFVLGPTFFVGENMRIRPYALIGGGLMRSKISEFAEHLSFKDTENFGVVDLGGGVYFYPIKRIGVRGEIRRFVGVGANDSEKGYGILDWDFYRVSVGVAIAF